MTAPGFLQSLRALLGDEFDLAPPPAGTIGADGRGLPEDKGDFGFATGIECSYPTIDDGHGGRLRRDLLIECGHDARWEEDLHLVKDLGLSLLRYGLPWHHAHVGDGVYDWSRCDGPMEGMRKLGITPILDLLHFGVPDWLGDFQNPELPVHFARYCDAVAERYPWVRFYTPVNEIYVAARFSALDGIWNERLKSHRGFVTALKHLTASAVAGCAAIARRRPDAVFVTSETAEYTHDMSAIPGDDVKLENRLRYLSLDLLYGKQPEALIYEYLLDNGMTREEFAWFMSGEPPGHQIMGNDYYGRNERLRLPDGTILEGEDVLGWYLITRRYYLRYYKPLFHTETNVFDPDEAPRWLWKQWANVLRMRRDGVPVLGFTWYSLTDQIDWDIGLKERRGTVNGCGLYDLDRKPRPVASAYRELIKNFGRISPIAHAKMFVLTDEAALLKAVA